MPRQHQNWELKTYEQMNRYERLAILLLEERDKREWSRDRLAEAIGVTSTAIMHWEQRNNFIGSDALERLARFKGEPTESLRAWLSGDAPQFIAPKFDIRALAEKMTGEQLFRLANELQEIAVKKIRIEEKRKNNKREVEVEVLPLKERIGRDFTRIQSQ